MSRRAPTDFPFGHLTDDAGASADPVLVEIVQGSLASVEMEVETAIGRTSRSPMIRDAHDFRAGIHDRLLRKLTGRSYSALVHPVARDFPIEEMREGDVFFHNDVYRSEGGIGHLPDLCVTVPVFSGGKVVAFVQAFGHHDDIGGAVPGSMPSHATSVFEEGLMVPPIRLWDAGVPNRSALAIMTRNSRMPESLAADLDAECSACLMGARRLGELFDRYGVAAVESSFDAIISRTTETYRREILSQIPVGSWVWEDYAEHDGVDEPQLHTQRITLTRTPADDPGTDGHSGERLILDFDGTSPQAKGPINHCGDYSDGVFLKKWLAPILRNLADSPERMAELEPWFELAGFPETRRALETQTMVTIDALDPAVDHDERIARGDGLGVRVDLLGCGVEGGDRACGAHHGGDEHRHRDERPPAVGPPVDGEHRPQAGRAHRGASAGVPGSMGPAIPSYARRKRSSRLGGVTVSVWIRAVCSRSTTVSRCSASVVNRLSTWPSSRSETRSPTPGTSRSPVGAATVTAWTCVLVCRRRSARVPVVTVRPWRMIVTRSASASTSPRMWLDNRTVHPSSRRSRTTSWNACSMSGSSPDVGSSRTSRSASTARAAMRATFCRLPFE